MKKRPRRIKLFFSKNFCLNWIKQGSKKESAASEKFAEFLENWLKKTLPSLCFKWRMIMAKVELKTVGDILLDKELELIIPDYQRGYRWRGGDSPENSQIVQLMDDIYEYVNNKKEYYSKDDSGNEIYKFYCLQPIVVARKNKNEKKYFLVDGQQRLTTLWLIYRYWKIKAVQPFLKYGDPEKILGEEVFSKCCYLKYETSRNDEFLNKIHNTTVDPSCGINGTLDEFYLAEAYRTIDRWCTGKNFDWMNANDISHEILKLLELKLENAIVNPSLQVIWYELEESEENVSDQIALFNRINRGKIPLTSAELIKAFLFGEFSSNQSTASSNAKENPERSRFEKEWEEIENTLSDDMFWGFLCNSEYETRIEFLFELLIIKYRPSVKETEESLGQKQNKSKPQRTFYLFKTIYENTFKTAYAAREEIFAYFQKLLKYYRSHELYHLIGYLVHIGKPMYEIVSELEDAPNYHVCVNRLKEAVKKKVFDNNAPNSSNNAASWVQQVDNVRYEKCENEIKEFVNKPLINKILLLFNIVTVIGNGLELQKAEKTNSKKTAHELYWFPFKQNRSISWDIEHICSQATENHLEEEDEKRQRTWCLTLLDYYYGCDLVDKELPDRDLLPELRKIKNVIDANVEKYPVAEKYDENDWSLKGINLRRSRILRDILSFLLNENDKKNFKAIQDAADELEREGKTAPVAAQDLSNLTLLDAQTNRSFKDAPYPVKRAKILKNERNGFFIPPCTKNVFLKAYSKTLDDMLYWDPSIDGTVYKTEIKNALSNFFNNTNSGNN